jgi:hypothetical protein
MPTRFKRTNKPNLDFAIDYGNYYGRVKLEGKFILPRNIVERSLTQFTNEVGGRSPAEP